MSRTHSTKFKLNNNLNGYGLYTLLTNFNIMIDFKKYHEENPHIWEAFKKYSLIAKNKRGFQNYSANGIFEIIRWHTDIASRDEYKVNNNFRPDYARKMMKEFPEFEKFFRIRELKANRT